MEIEIFFWINNENKNNMLFRTFGSFGKLTLLLFRIFLIKAAGSSSGKI